MSLIHQSLPHAFQQRAGPLRALWFGTLCFCNVLVIVLNASALGQHWFSGISLTTIYAMSLVAFLTAITTFDDRRNRQKAFFALLLAFVLAYLLVIYHVRLLAWLGTFLIPICGYVYFQKTLRGRWFSSLLAALLLLSVFLLVGDGRVGFRYAEPILALGAVRTLLDIRVLLALAAFLMILIFASWRAFAETSSMLRPRTVEPRSRGLSIELARLIAGVVLYLFEFVIAFCAALKRNVGYVCMRVAATLSFRTAMHFVRLFLYLVVATRYLPIFVQALHDHLTLAPRLSGVASVMFGMVVTTVFAELIRRHIRHGVAGRELVHRHAVFHFVVAVSSWVATAVAIAITYLLPVHLAGFGPGSVVPVFFVLVPLVMMLSLGFASRRTTSRALT